jgi:DNA-binding transcriptional MerR regulator
VDALLFIRRAQELGFSLREIGSVLPHVYGSQVDCASVLASLRHKINEIDNHLARTLEVKAGIAALIGELESRRRERQRMGVAKKSEV